MVGVDAGPTAPHALTTEAAHDKWVVSLGVGPVGQLGEELAIVGGRQIELLADVCALGARLGPPRSLEVENCPFEVGECHGSKPDRGRDPNQAPPR